MDREKIDKQLQKLRNKWQALGNYISMAEISREFLKESMQEVLEGLGVDRYEDSDGNLWVLQRGENGEPLHMMYVPIGSRLRQQPKFQPRKRGI